ncbi:MAG TPA: CBS domain-containing protein [Saprospiraceae bacterium]|nr:CBS domain-containing protein [Saprospiraceae bacterium]HMP23634.1 CBS domain-containing protein [Saprospiraceae bacterium]
MNPERSVREIMTTRLVTVSPETGANEVLNIFKNNDFHHIPVTEKGGVLTGIISKEDFFKVSYLLSQQTTGRTWTEKHYQTMEARDFMTQYPVVLDPEDTIGLAADIFLANKFHALPVVEEQQLLGMVTTHDLLKYSFNSNFVGDKSADDRFFVAENTDNDDNELF